jgi:hypothetical protein
LFYGKRSPFYICHWWGQNHAHVYLFHMQANIWRNVSIIRINSSHVIVAKLVKPVSCKIKKTITLSNFDQCGMAFESGFFCCFLRRFTPLIWAKNIETAILQGTKWWGLGNFMDHTLKRCGFSVFSAIVQRRYFFLELVAGMPGYELTMGYEKMLDVKQRSFLIIQKTYSFSISTLWSFLWMDLFFA